MSGVIGREDTIARAGGPARAVVWVGAEETAYLRAGRGPVVMLLSREYDADCALELIGLLSEEFLVIAPKVPRADGEGALGGWLSNVMDGLGIGRASIIAETPFICDVMRFAEDEDARVERVALLSARLDTAGAAQFLEGAHSV